MSPQQYNITMTSDWIPFEIMRDVTSRISSPSVEQVLPLYNDSDDEDDVIVETQQQNPIGILFWLLFFTLYYIHLHYFYTT